MVTIYFDVTSSGTGYTSPIYRQNGNWYSDSACTSVTDHVSPIPSYTTGGFAFVGYYYNGTKYINADGTFTSAMGTFNPSSNLTMVAHYERVLWTITLNDNGGSGGQGGLYYKLDGGGLYTDLALENVATSVTPPQKSSGNFLGYFSSSTGGTKYIGVDGLILPSLSSLALSADNEIFAQWGIQTTITLSKHGGAGGESHLYADSESGLIYSDPELTHAVNSVTPPTKVGSSFLGYFSTSTGGTKYINANGTFTSSFSYVQSNITMHALWTENAKVLTLDANGGSGSPIYLFYKNGWYADEALTIHTSRITIPNRKGYTFVGFKVSSTTYIDASGTILISSINTDTNAKASWTAKTYIVGFDYDGGTWNGQTQKSVTFGQPVGSLPTTTKAGYDFGGWRFAESIIIDANTLWTIDSGGTLKAWWKNAGFAKIEDYFKLSSSSLLPIASDSGDNRQRIVYSHTGKIDGAETSPCVWRNPRVTYAVKSEMTLEVTLGKAFSAKNGVTGYMIVAVTVDTRVGQYPTVTVEAVANEGADAINQWSVSIPIVARSKAQNLLNGVNGGGRLNACSVTACCDPVVIAENMMPCASDIVAGRIELTATTIATNNESAPTAAGGFTALGAPKVGTDAYYTTYNLTAQKEL